jgi:hypothetical protein
MQSVCDYAAVSKFFFAQDVHTGCVNQPASYSMDIKGERLTAHLHLMQRSRTGSATFYMLPWHTQGQLYLF